MKAQTQITDSPEKTQSGVSGCLVIPLIIFLIAQGLLIWIISMTWWPRDDLVYCLLSLVSVVIIIAIVTITITSNKQTQAVKNRMGMINLILGSLGAVGWLIFYTLSKDPSVPLADFQIVGKLFGQLCMPLVCFLFGVGGWLASRSEIWRILGYFLFFLGLALLVWNEYAMLAYGLT